LSFPASPTDGQTATVNGVLYTYTAAAGSWTRFTSGAGTSPVVYSGNVSYSNLSVTGNLTYANLVSNGVSRSAIAYTATAGTPPATPIIGDQWYDTNTDSLYTYFTDGTSTFWLDISDSPNFVKFTTSSTAPANPNVGDQWYDSSTDSLYTRISDGVSSYWVDLLSSKGGIIYNTTATLPTVSRPGDQWYDISSDVLYTRITDGTSSYWVDLSTRTPTGNISLGNSSVSISGNNGPVSINVNNSNIITASTGVAAITGNLTLSGSQTVNGNLSVLGTSTLNNITETVNIITGAPSAPYNADLLSGTIIYYTGNANANITVNVRGNSAIAFNSVINIGQSMGFAFLVTNGASAYYITSLTIDGAAQTVRWVNGSAPTSGNTNSIDAYNFNIIKTGNSSYTVLGNQTKFA
jgi:hypothetical protein